MADPSPKPTVLLAEADIARVVADLAARIAPVIDDDTVAAVLLTGGLWFAADLTRALSRLGRNVRFDALWLASYGDAQSSRGRIDVHAPFQRSLEGRKVLILRGRCPRGRARRGKSRPLRLIQMPCRPTSSRYRRMRFASG